MTNIQILLSILGIVVATWIPLYIFRAGRFNVAAANFRNTFNVAVHHIENGQDEIAVIEANFPSHAEGTRIFMNHLSGRELTRFEKAWAEYQQWHKVICNRGTTSKLFPETDNEYLVIKKIKGIDLIHKLLQFADDK